MTDLGENRKQREFKQSSPFLTLENIANFSQHWKQKDYERLIMKQQETGGTRITTSLLFSAGAQGTGLVKFRQVLGQDLKQISDWTF